jgi:hypothetical protein
MRARPTEPGDVGGAIENLRPCLAGARLGMSDVSGATRTVILPLSPDGSLGSELGSLSLQAEAAATASAVTAVNAHVSAFRLIASPEQVEVLHEIATSPAEASAGFVGHSE